MIVGVQLFGGNSAPNSGNNHKLTNHSKVVCKDSRYKDRVYSGTEGTNQKRH